MSVSLSACPPVLSVITGIDTAKVVIYKVVNRHRANDEEEQDSMAKLTILPNPCLMLSASIAQVEGQVMGSSSENILKQSFGGVYSNELFAEGGRLYSERPEPFSYISVEVRFRTSPLLPCQKPKIPLASRLPPPNK